ncbi:uncharacterized protein LOC118755091 [Rhagoletis pomonella]|uniref:uncharacterized protein LOC118755091 n=1 Tax=Rhagoletis pomonella TaxID=28610 RepID=UPI00177D78E3|nr:uncharacterized protein LOC118755091 [Rhagoletis pomonella]
MSVFDPFGMLAAFLITTKILIQEAWKCEIGWDEVLPQELNKIWWHWWQEFPNVKQLKIPRCYSPQILHGGKVEIHTFVDASQVAFAAVVYVRVLHINGVDVRFIMGKTRTAPAELMSIPRLELQAAVLGTRLYKLIEDSHEVNIGRAVFWTDSQTVLQWVHSSERKYKAFVGHRIAEIHNGTTAKEQWRWVSTCQNAADVATRPLCPPKFDSSSEQQYYFENRATVQHQCRQASQRDCFSSEIAGLSVGGKIAKRSSLYKLSPYLDQSGLLRLSGRIDEATYLPMQARRPILMPAKHIVSTLIVQHFHKINHHQNSAITINAIRQQFWIPNLKPLLKAVQQRCQQCMIDKAKPNQPMMGQLPVNRITPINVTIGMRKEKRWGVIFTCLTVRAAHIELATDLSTDAFILCLRNFVNRRGTPSRIRSDNGTNFIGAQRELRAAEQLLVTDRIQAEAGRHNIEWIFNCPLNPSSGGCWERLIRIIKSLLSKTLREVAPRPDTLHSVLIEAEYIINSRPLTDLPISHEEDEPLTPNHFLLGCVNSTQTPHPVDEKICLRKQWRIAQNIKDRLWKRWTAEYLPKLLCRTKWQDKAIPLQANDLVILCDSTLPRSQWVRGRITQVFPTKDGQVRIVEVRTKSGLPRRPVSRLAKLEVGGESYENSRGAGC